MVNDSTENELNSDTQNELRRARAEALIESTRSLLLLNGGAVIAVATWLQAVWSQPWAAHMCRPMIVGIFFLVIGAASAGMTPFARYRAGLNFPKKEGWWYANQWLTGLSLGAFLVGMLVVLGAAWCVAP